MPIPRPQAKRAAEVLADAKRAPRNPRHARTKLLVYSVQYNRFRARGLFDQAAPRHRCSQLAGREMAYATLMYIWSNRDPIGTVIDNPPHQPREDDRRG